MDMSPQSKEEYFEVLHKRYKGASRREKKSLLMNVARFAVITGNMRSGG
jgi:hypothetical protein